MPSLKGRRFIVFVGTDYEDAELWYPKYRLIEAGATVVTVGLEAGATYLSKHGYPARADAAARGIKPARFDGVVIPGGWMPDRLRRDPHVLDIVRRLDRAGKLVASICHGPWIDASAGVVKGVRYTSTPGIKDDLVHAGAKWSDAPVVVDRNHVSSRKPDDLPCFMQGVFRVLGAGG